MRKRSAVGNTEKSAVGSTFDEQTPLLFCSRGVRVLFYAQPMVPGLGSRMRMGFRK